eukprot:SAG31_NODE_13659_length_854_cov_28.711258_1_plen_85_part_00
MCVGRVGRVDTPSRWRSAKSVVVYSTPIVALVRSEEDGFHDPGRKCSTKNDETETIAQRVARDNMFMFRRISDTELWVPKHTPT